MRLLARIKETLLNSKYATAGMRKKKTMVSGTRTRYGKKLSLSSGEKAQLVDSLTPREKETFFILLGGYNLRETAEQLNVRYSTANTYQTAIYKKLHVNSRAELIINFSDMCETGQG